MAKKKTVTPTFRHPVLLRLTADGCELRVAKAHRASLLSWLDEMLRTTASQREAKPAQQDRDIVLQGLAAGPRAEALKAILVDPRLTAEREVLSRLKIEDKCIVILYFYFVQGARHVKPSDLKNRLNDLGEDTRDLRVDRLLAELKEKKQQSGTKRGRKYAISAEGINHAEELLGCIARPENVVLMEDRRSRP